VRGNEVAERHFEILRLERGGRGEKLVARASGEDDEIGFVLGAAGSQPHALAISSHLRNP